MNTLKLQMAVDLLRGTQVTGPEFKPSPISFRELNAKLPTAIFTVTQLSSSAEVRASSPRMWNSNCAWVELAGWSVFMLESLGFEQEKEACEPG